MYVTDWLTIECLEVSKGDILSARLLLYDSTGLALIGTDSTLFLLFRRIL